METLLDFNIENGISPMPFNSSELTDVLMFLQHAKDYVLRDSAVTAFDAWRILLHAQDDVIVNYTKRIS